MLKPCKAYEEVYHSFQWQIPEFYNIGVDICDKWADRGNRLSLIYEDENGHKDDVITSAGYHIGPAEIEDCLMKHPAVAMVAVVGRPDEVRTEIVKAFIVPKADITPGPEVAEDIKTFVKTRPAAQEYPHDIEFVSELPMTATGKIMRRELKKIDE